MDGPAPIGKPCEGAGERESLQEDGRPLASPRPYASQVGEGAVQEGKKKGRGRHSSPKHVRIAMPEHGAPGNRGGSPGGPAAADGTSTVPTNEDGTPNMAHTDNPSEGLLSHSQNPCALSAGNDHPLQQGTLTLATFACKLPAEPPPAIHSTGLVAVEFDRPEVVCTEDMEAVEATVRRLGDLRGHLECGWEIRNGNLEGPCFQALSPRAGTVTFEKGEEIATITLPVVRDPAWTVERVYFVDLLPGTLRAAADLGIEPVLKTNPEMAVYILNQDGFPANGVSPDAPLRQLVLGFIRHNTKNFPRETAWGVVFSIFPALHYYLSAKLQELLLDCGINPDKACDLWGSEVSSGGSTLLFVVQGLFVALLALEYLVRKWRRELRLGGKVVRSLRTSMFATMLQLTPEAKEHYDQGDIPKALDTDVTLAVRSVWLQYFGLIKESFLMLFKMVLIVRIALQADLADTTVVIILAPIAMAIITYLSVALRSVRQASMTGRALQAEEEWSTFVTMSDECAPLITGYRKGWSVAQKFNSIHAAYNKEDAQAADYADDSSEILKGCFTLITALVAVVGGLSVRSRSIEVGSFVVLLRVVGGFGASLRSVAGALKTIAVGGAAVKRIADILNEETRRRHQLSAGKLNEKSAFFCNSEQSSISLQRVRFCYHARPQQDPRGGAVPQLDLELPSGHLVYFPSAEGRESWPGVRTLFQLIAGELLPTDGFVVHPPSWTFKYVPVDPILFDGPLILNLYLGDGEPPPREVIWEVCRALQLSPELIGDEEYDVGINGDSLRHSDKLIVSIVRALLSDADVLLLGPCLDVLGERAGVEVLRYLTRYIECRGLPQGGPPFLVRHAKTVVYTSKHSSLQGEAQLTVSTIEASGGRPPYRPPSLPGFRLRRPMPSLPGFKPPPPTRRAKKSRALRRAAATAVLGGLGRDWGSRRGRLQSE